MLFVICDFFQNQPFWKNSFRNTMKVSNSLEIGPDLGPNCLQRLSADDTSRQRGLINSYRVEPRYSLLRK